MILSLLDTGDVFYDSTTNKYLQNLQVLRNCAVSVTYKLSARTNVEAEHRIMNLMTLDVRRKRHISQLASLLSHRGSFVEVQILPTRVHNVLWRNLIVRKSTSWFTKNLSSPKQRSIGIACLHQYLGISDQEMLKVELKKQTVDTTVKIVHK